MILPLEPLFDTFSVIGQKTCSISDTKIQAFRFTDTGGIFGRQLDISLTAAEFCYKANPIVFTGANSGRRNAAIMKVQLDDGAAICQTQDISRLMPIFHEITKSLNISNMYFPATLDSREIAPFTSLYAPESKNISASVWIPEASFPSLHDDALNQSTLPICFSRSDNRLVIGILYCDPVSIPINQIGFEIVGTRIIFKLRFLVEGFQISGLTVDFPDKQILDRIVDELRLDRQTQNIKTSSGTQTTNGDLLCQVSAEGFLAGEALQKTECDAALSDKKLTLFVASTSRKLIAIDFTHSALAIEGTSEHFLISPSNNTLLRISTTDPAFHHAIASNAALAAAAKRSSTSGPYIATNENGRLIRLSNVDGTLQISQGKGASPLEIQSSRPPTVSFEGPQPTIRINKLSLSAQLPMLQGILTELESMTIDNVIDKRFEDAIAEIVGLEGIYFAYTIFGELIESEQILEEVTHLPIQDSFSELTNEADIQTFLNAMTTVPAILARRMEFNLHYLPTFALNADSELLKQSGVRNDLKSRSVEQAYQHAISPCNSLATHLQRIDAYAARNIAVHKATSQKNSWGQFAPLGMSAAMTLLGSPMAAVGLVNQGMAVSRANETAARSQQESFIETFTKCSDEWDFLFNVLLPPVAHQVSRDIYPLRLATASHLLAAHKKSGVEDRRKIATAAYRRLARLKAFCALPGDPSCKLPRSEIAKFLIHFQVTAETDSFVMF